MAADPAVYARAGYATGYAEHGPVPVPDWAQADCKRIIAAAREHPDHPALIEAAVHSGRLTGKRAALERQRQALYDKHKAGLLSIATVVASHLSLADLHMRVSTAGSPVAAKAEAAAELDRAIALSDQSTPLATANRQAGNAAVVLGAATAAASVAARKLPTTTAVDSMVAIMDGGPVGATVDTSSWAGLEAGGWATDLTRAALTSADVLDLAASDATGVAWWLEDLMHQSWNVGFVITATSLDAPVNYMAMSDACLMCLDNAAGSPYWSATDVPFIPAHGGCRCWTETADAADLAAVA